MAIDLMCALGDSDLNTHLWYNLGNFKNNEYLGLSLKVLRIMIVFQKRIRKKNSFQDFSIIHLIYL